MVFRRSAAYTLHLSRTPSARAMEALAVVAPFHGPATTMFTAGVKLSFVTAPATGWDEACPLRSPTSRPAARSAASRSSSVRMSCAGAMGEVQNALVMAAPPVAVYGVPRLISVCAR